MGKQNIKEAVVLKIIVGLKSFLKIKIIVVKIFYSSLVTWIVKKDILVFLIPGSYFIFLGIFRIIRIKIVIFKPNLKV